jgi:hypothetical protein
MGNIISDIIGLLASIFTILTFYKDIISGYIPFLAPIINNVYFLWFMVFLIFLSCILFFMRGISIDVNYVLDEDSNGLDLSMGRIQSQFGDNMRLIIQKENECTHYDKILSFFKCKLLVFVEYPRGIKINAEGLGSEFTRLNPTPLEFVLIGDLDLLNGRREVELYIEAEEDTSYRGNSPIFVKVYIAPQKESIRKLLLTILNSHGFSKINILSDI